jgi:hypothetical protein
MNISMHSDIPVKIVKNTEYTTDNSNLENQEEDEISSVITKIKKKYSDNADQKHLNQLYDVGILIANKKINDKFASKLSKIIDERSSNPIREVREAKRQMLLDAFKNGLNDGLSNEYRSVYDSSGNFQSDSAKLAKRAHIDKILSKFS